MPQDGRLAEGSNDANSNGLLQKLKVMEESYRSVLTKIEVITAEVFLITMCTLNTCIHADRLVSIHVGLHIYITFWRCNECVCYNLLCGVLQRDVFADDFIKERDDRSRVAGEKDQLASELEAAQQKISEMSAKLSGAIKEIDHLSAGLRQTTDELNRAKEEIAVKVAQVKQYQKQVEAYKQQVEQVHIQLSMCMHQNIYVHTVYMYMTYTYMYNGEFVWQREVGGEYILYMNRNIHFSLIHI